MERSVLMPVWSAKFFHFYLIATVAGLATVYLALVDQIGNESLFGNGCLFWGGCLYLLWQKRRDFSFGSDPVSSIVGLLIVALVLVRTVSLPTEAALLAFPFISVLGITLLASGWRRLGQFKNILLILFFLGLPQLLIGAFLDISIVTARVSAFMLWYTGFEVVLRGVFVYLPGGSIEVYRGCSGLGNMLYMLGISVMFSVFLPISRPKRLLAIGVAVGLGFFINAIRVALLALIVANSTEEAFDYWHLGGGSLIFSMLTVLLFGCFYILLIKWQVHSPTKGLAAEGLAMDELLVGEASTGGGSVGSSIDIGSDDIGLDIGSVDQGYTDTGLMDRELANRELANRELSNREQLKPQRIDL